MLKEFNKSKKDLDTEVILSMNLRDLIYIYAAVGKSTTNSREQMYPCIDIESKEIEPYCESGFECGTYNSICNILERHGIRECL